MHGNVEVDSKLGVWILVHVHSGAEVRREVGASFHNGKDDLPETLYKERES